MTKPITAAMPESDVDAFNLPRPRSHEEYLAWILAAERQRDRRLAIMRHAEKITGRLLALGAIGFALAVLSQAWSAFQCG